MMDTNHKVDKWLIVACLGILLLSCLFFVYSVKVRHPWFGSFTENQHEWLTGSTLKFARNWYREGPWNLKFAMLENPKSPEFTTLISRGPYISYPPGTVIPIYLISILIHQEPTISLVMAYNLLNQWLIAIVLALTIFFFLRSLEFDYVVSFFFSLIPVLLEMLLPEPFYFHQNVFFSDQAVVLPFSLAVFLEVVRDNFEGRWRRYLDILQAVIFFYGVFTDWLFVFVLVFIYLKRIIAGEIPISNKVLFLKKSLFFAAAPIAAIAVFMIQIYWIYEANIRKAIDAYVNLFKVRVGFGAVNETSTGYYLDAISDHIRNGYGSAGIWLVFASGIFVLVGAVYLVWVRFKSKDSERDIKRIELLALIVVGPCLAQIYFLKNHSAIHSFSVLKLSLVISTVPFVLIPLFLAFFIRKYVKADVQKIMEFLLLPVLLFLGIYLIFTQPLYVNMFANNDRAKYDFAYSIERQTDENDVVFSPDHEIPDNAPQQISISMKRVYQVDTVNDILDHIEGIGGDYRVVWVYEKPEDNSRWRIDGLPVEAFEEDGSLD